MSEQPEIHLQEEAEVKEEEEEEEEEEELEMEERKMFENDKRKGPSWWLPGAVMKGAGLSDHLINVNEFVFLSRIFFHLTHEYQLMQPYTYTQTQTHTDTRITHWHTPGYQFMNQRIGPTFHLFHLMIDYWLGRDWNQVEIGWRWVDSAVDSWRDWLTFIGRVCSGRLELSVVYGW